MTEQHRAPRRRLQGSSLLMLVALFLGVAMLAPTVQQVIGQRQRIADLEGTIATTQADIDRLNAEKLRWDDPAYVVAQARGRLLFVQPGDTTYLVLDGSPAPVAADGRDIASDQHETDSDPVALLLDSLIRSASTQPGPQPGDQPQPTVDQGAPTP